MKRLLLLLCTVLIAVCLCSCMRQAEKNVKQGAETLATEIMENMDDMVDNGTVNDGDGYIDEHRDKKRSTYTYPATESGERQDKNADYGDIADDDGLIRDDKAETENAFV